MNSQSRRSFIAQTIRSGLVSLVGGPALLSGCSLRSNSAVRVGLIGAGVRGLQLMKILTGTRRARLVAIADVDQGHRTQALRYLEKAVPTFNDYRDLLARGDVEAVVIATPDHWHTLQVVDACRAGKDVYCEKPLTLTVDEGNSCIHAVRSCNRILQVGLHQRSEYGGRFRRAAELVRNGYLGEIRRVEVSTGEGARRGGTDPEIQPPPGLDWDRWLGQAPWVPYKKSRCHQTFRWWRDYSGGRLTDWGCHHIDIAQWALGYENSGPVRIQGTGKFPQPGGYDNAYAYDITFTYENGTVLVCTSGTPNGIRFIGTEGEVWVSRNQLETKPPGLANANLSPRDKRLYYSESREYNHLKEWLKCVVSREEPVCPVEQGHRSATVCHLGNIAIRLQREIRWNPEQEKILQDPEAQSMLFRPQREPYRIPPA